MIQVHEIGRVESEYYGLMVRRRIKIDQSQTQISSAIYYQCSVVHQMVCGPKGDDTLAVDGRSAGGIILLLEGERNQRVWFHALYFQHN